MIPTALRTTLQTYNRGTSLTTASFWKSFIEACFDGAVCFTLVYFSAVPGGRDQTDALWGIGKTSFLCLLGAVTVEVCLIARFWTRQG